MKIQKIAASILFLIIFGQPRGRPCGRVSENEYFIKGVNALVEGRSDEAIANLNKAIELNPGRADAYHNRVKADELITRRRAKQSFVISC